jgi:transposase InsO family protein
LWVFEAHDLSEDPMQHPNAKLTPAGRRRLVGLVEEHGYSLAHAARVAGVAKSTAWEWTVRWRRAGAGERATLACLRDRSSRPRRSPRRTAQALERRILRERERTGWGPRLIAGETGIAHSTVHQVLRRHGRSRAPVAPRERARRYEWPCPGDLLHMDTKRYARFGRPGHALTGDRSRARGGWARQAGGFEFAHAVVDDRSRLAYVELHPDERAATVTGFVERALAWFASQGVRARRILTDNAFSYTHNRSLGELLRSRAIAHWTTRPYCPRTNGKVERFHQTMAREWGYGQLYRTDRHRARALPYWLRYYNERRPHSALGGRPPISRVRNVPGQDS